MNKNIDLKIDEFSEKIEELEKKLNEAVLKNDKQQIEQYSRELSETQKDIETLKKLRDIEEKIKSARKVLNEGRGTEMERLALEEIEQLKAEKEKVQKESKSKKEENIPAIVEIRAGAGGEEAALFAADLYRMYIRYCERKQFKITLLDTTPTDLGGFKTVIFKIEGPNAYSLLKNESGVHRVQRIPITEASGRIHTSTATVAVLPARTEREVIIKPEEIRVDVFRAKGPGGQGVNTTDSAVRIMHLPTGISVKSQETRSQIKNRQLALEILRSKLYEIAQESELDKERKLRKSMIGKGQRAEKIRTYNFNQDRITDHRIKKTWHGIEKVLSGEIDEIIDTLHKRLGDQ